MSDFRPHVHRQKYRFDYIKFPFICLWYDGSYPHSQNFKIELSISIAGQKTKDTSAVISQHSPLKTL